MRPDAAGGTADKKTKTQRRAVLSGGAPFHASIEYRSDNGPGHLVKLNVTVNLAVEPW